jgi:prepilin-type processing-associated H-X9-DG protein
MDQYPGGGTYFEKVSLSYDYPSGTYANQSLAAVTRGGSSATSTKYLMYDYDPFHDAGGTFNSRNYLYLDGHVD